MVKSVLQILVFASNQSDFENRRQQLLKILTTGQQVAIGWVDSTQETRLQALQKKNNQWCLFIDSDCELSSEVLQRILMQVKAHPKDDWDDPYGRTEQIGAGLYRNPLQATPLQRAHNLIANFWVQQSENKPKKNFLGGLFLIYADSGKFKTAAQSTSSIMQQMTLQASSRDSSKASSKKLFWGAEDKQLAYVLQSAGYHIQVQKELFVIHHTSNRWRHFFKRAWAHGVNDVDFIRENFKWQNPVNYFYWLQKIEMSDWPLIPLVALHFAIQKTAKLARTVLRANNLK